MRDRLLFRIAKWSRCKSAATAIEYALIAAGISLAIAAFVFTFGQELGDVFLNLPAYLEL